MYEVKSCLIVGIPFKKKKSLCLVNKANLLYKQKGNLFFRKASWKRNVKKIDAVKKKKAEQ